MARLIKPFVLTLLALALLANAAGFAAVWVTRDPAPRALDGQRIFTASEPAVVLIQANYDAVSYTHLTLPTICSV